jgi:acyl dehydratase
MEGELLPKHCLINQDQNEVLSLDENPILHTTQQIIWHMPPDQLPSQGSFRLKRRIVAVSPKAVGTFVTTQFDIFPRSAEYKSSNNNNRSELVVTTIQTTALILGLDPCRVRRWRAMKTNGDDASSYIEPVSPSWTPGEPPSVPPTYTQYISIPPNQALLYRLASGDTNAIHVNPDANPLQNSNVDDNDNNGTGTSTTTGNTRKGCVLHGLATLGIVARVILQHSSCHSCQSSSSSWYSMQATFAAPVYVGDTLYIEVWCTQQRNEKKNDPPASSLLTPQQQINFRATVKSKVVLKHGVITLRPRRSKL